jgi:HSP20 family protein
MFKSDNTSKMGNVFLDSVLKMLEKELDSLKTPPTNQQDKTDLHHELNGGKINDNVKQSECTPNIDINDYGNIYELFIDAPGVAKETIELRVTDPRTIVVSFIRESTHQTNDIKPVLREVKYGNFVRGLMFKSEIDAENIKAIHNNGILHVVIPKKISSIGKKIVIQ